MSVFIFLVLLTGIALVFWKDILAFLKLQRAQPKQKQQTVKQYIDRLNGKTKVSYLEQSKSSVKDILAKTQMSERYGSIVRRSLCLAVLGACVGLALSNVLLAAVLFCGGYFIPMWATQFSLYSYKKAVNEELEIALSLITTSYVRGNDILKAVTENLDNIHYPVKDAFVAFVNALRYVSTGITPELDKLKARIDNPIFRQWCDLLILCQGDHTLKHTLLPVVNKFSELKAQQDENASNMMLPLQSTIKMVCIVIAIIPLLFFFSDIWFYSLPGRIILAVTAVAIFWCLNAAIKLSAPIEYEV